MCVRCKRTIKCTGSFALRSIRSSFCAVFKCARAGAKVRPLPSAWRWIPSSVFWWNLTAKFFINLFWTFCFFPQNQLFSINQSINQSYRPLKERNYSRFQPFSRRFCWKRVPHMQNPSVSSYRHPTEQPNQLWKQKQIFSILKWSPGKIFFFFKIFCCFPRKGSENGWNLAWFLVSNMFLWTVFIFHVNPTQNAGQFSTTSSVHVKINTWWPFFVSGRNGPVYNASFYFIWIVARRKGTGKRRF